METAAELLAGRYEIRGPLDQDGVAQSYRAGDLRLGCEVRLRRLHEPLARDPLVRRRFRQELVALRRLSHPRVLAGYELVEQDGELFFTTELPGGRPLPELLERGSLPAQRTARLFRQLLEALAHVHERGVLHRDLQPRHISVAEGPAEELKLGGFALGCVGDLAAVTMSSQLIGSPRYRAPEVLRGETADAASDLYAAGLVLAEMLTGRPLWPQESILDQARCKSERVEDWPQRLGLEPESRSAALARTLLPGLLEPDPLRRWRNAGEAIAALDMAGACVPETAPAAPRPPVEARARTCLACGEPMDLGAAPTEGSTRREPALEWCPACGLAPQSVTEWSAGPYTLILWTVRPGGRWEGDLGDDPARRVEALRLIELLYGPLGPGVARTLGRGLALARRVDAATADKLQSVFAAKGLQLRRFRLGGLGDLALSLFPLLRRRLSWAVFLAPFVAVPVGLFVVPNALFVAGWSLPAVTGIGIFLCLLPALVGLALIGLPEAPAAVPRILWTAPGQARRMDGPAPEVREAYRQIGDPELRLAARRLLAGTRAAESEQAPGLREVLRSLETAALRLLASVPPRIPRREGELLAEAQRLEDRLAVDSLQARPELERAHREVLEALQKLEEAERLRTQAEQRVGRCVLALEEARKQGPEGQGPGLAERARQALDALADPR
jgi:hypothetical protein